MNRVTSLVPDGKERAERDIVRAVLAGLHRQVAAALAGDAECHVGAHQFRRASRAGMSSCPTCAPSLAGLAHQISAVVQQERDAARLRHRAQHVDRAAPGIIVNVLQPKLHRRDIAGIQRGCQRSANGTGSSCGGVIR